MGALIDVNIKGVRHLYDYMTTMGNFAGILVSLLVGCTLLSATVARAETATLVVATREVRQFFPLVSSWYHMNPIGLGDAWQVGGIDNLWDRDVALKVAFGVPDDALLRTGKLLNITPCVSPPRAKPAFRCRRCPVQAQPEPIVLLPARGYISSRSVPPSRDA